MATSHRITTLGFDADDTLWHSEESFRKNERQFVDLVRPYVADGVDIKSALVACMTACCAMSD